MQQPKSRNTNKISINVSRPAIGSEQQTPGLSARKSKSKQNSKLQMKEYPSRQLSIPSSPSKQQSALISSPDINQDDSPNRRRKNQTFLTQPRRLSEVELAHRQLNNYINMLDEKIDKYIQRNQAEFIIAYRNHTKRIRQEMEEIRNKALTNADSSVSQTQKIERLQKQVIIYRDESLKLFEKTNQHEKTIYSLSSKIKQLQNENQHMQRSLKTLIKRNKQLQAERYSEMVMNKQAISINNNQLKQFRISRPSERVSNTGGEQESLKFVEVDRFVDGSIHTKSRPYTTAINSRGASVRSRMQSVQLSRLNQRNPTNQQINQINIQLDNILKDKVNQQLTNQLKDKIAEIIKSNETQVENLNINQYTEKNRFSQLSKNTKKSYMGINNSMVTRTSKSFVDSKNMARRSQLEQYFFKSIEEVKKQITRRKGLKSINFYSQYANMSISQFKKVDFFRILELLFVNEKAVLALHKAIFQDSKPYK